MRTLWCSTPFGIIGILTAPRAQFLARVWCAQRLSASSEFSPPVFEFKVILFAVLNAFRHHRNSHTQYPHILDHVLLCSTPFGIIGILTEAVLTPDESTALCSTPFGIIGILTLNFQ